MLWHFGTLPSIQYAATRITLLKQTSSCHSLAQDSLVPSHCPFCSTWPVMRSSRIWDLSSCRLLSAVFQPSIVLSLCLELLPRAPCHPPQSCAMNCPTYSPCKTATHSKGLWEDILIALSPYGSVKPHRLPYDSLSRVGCPPFRALASRSVYGHWVWQEPDAAR